MKKDQDQLEKEYSEVRNQIIAKIKEASKLLKEANSLVKKANVHGEFTLGADYDGDDACRTKAKYLIDLRWCHYLSTLQTVNGEESLSAKDIKEYKKLSDSLGNLYDTMDNSGWRTSSWDCYND